MRELIELWNPWWDNGEVPEKRRGITRSTYAKPLTKEADSGFVSVVTGPRHTGKTTVMHQVIQALLDRGVDQKYILYAMLDSPALSPRDTIGEILREFRKRNNIQRRERIYVFLDEAQYIPDWARWAKAVHDSENAKLYISGSTRAMLVQDSYASLVGRWRKTFVYPLSLIEFLEFRGAKISSAEQYRYERYLEEYARTGGFPEVVCCQDNAEVHRILASYFDDFVFKDAARVRSVRDLETLKTVALLMAQSIGTTLSINKIAKTLKVSTAAISTYINALCSVYLYCPCAFYSTSAAERVYNPKKYYIVDTGLGATVTGKFNMGAAIENMIYNHLIKRSDTYYWKSGHELDFYLPQEKLAIEVKYKKEVEDGELKGLLEFAKRTKLKTAQVVTSSYVGEKDFGKVNYTHLKVRAFPNLDNPYIPPLKGRALLSKFVKVEYVSAWDVLLSSNN